MKVLTDNPIIVDNNHSSFKGSEERRKRREARRSNREGKSFLDKSKNGVSKAQEGINKAQGLISSLGSILGSEPSDRGADVSYEPLPDDEGMSNGAKIGIVAGGIAVIGLIIFAIVKSKGKKGK